ncbi:MAG: hypothetical protein HYX48_04290 [Chlamydiales bacterium]|nr:hypothetical protein [Chlamydiales bacterium]
MATGAASAAGKYFYATHDPLGQVLKIELTDEKRQSAIDFLSSVRSHLSDAKQVVLAADGRPLKEIVTAVVAGYEAKRGCLQRIWECFLRILGFQTDLDLLVETSTEIRVASVGRGYQPAFFIPQLKTIIDFLKEIPEILADYRFTKQKGIQPPFAYSNPQDPSQPRSLDALSVQRCLTLAEELHPFFQICRESTSQEHLEKKGPERKDPSPIGSEKEKVESVVHSFNQIFMIAAVIALDNGDVLGAARYLSKTSYRSDQENPKLVSRVVEECLKRGEILAAHKATSCMKPEERVEVERAIAVAGLKKEHFTNDDFQALKLIATSPTFSNDDRFVKDFIDACIRQGHSYPFKAFMALGKHAPISRAVDVAQVYIKPGRSKVTEAEQIALMVSGETRGNIFVLLASHYIESDQFEKAIQALCNPEVDLTSRNELLSLIIGKYIHKKEWGNALQTLCCCIYDPEKDEEGCGEVFKMAGVIYDHYIHLKDFPNALRAILNNHSDFFKMANKIFLETCLIPPFKIAFAAIERMPEKEHNGRLMTLGDRMLHTLSEKGSERKKN